MHAYNLQRVDRKQDIYLQAWANQQATATKQEGKKTISAYKSFKDFFDYEKELQAIEGVKKDPHISRLASLAAKVNG